MILGFQIDRIKYPVDKIPTVAGGEGTNVDASLLQSLLGIEQIGGVLQLTLHSFVASHLCPIKASAQAINLIVDLASSFFQGVGQSWNYAFQLFLQSIQFRIAGFDR